MRLRPVRIAVLGIALTTSAARFALADAPSPSLAVAPAPVPDALMKGLAAHAERLEQMKRRGAYTFTGTMEALDGDGKVDEHTEMQCRSTPTGHGLDRIVKWIRYVEDGKNHTAERQEKSDEYREERKKEAAEGKKNKSDWKVPFLASEQGRYLFAIDPPDAANPGRRRIFFKPKEPAEDAFKGSVWVDEKTQEILSAGFSLSKNPTFVDHVDVTIIFGMMTPLGRAPSQLTFDGRGGFLFVHKHYRGTGTLSDPQLVF